MKHHARGTFEVALKSLDSDPTVGGPLIGRMSIDKQFHGDLEATSKGQMVAMRSAVKGSAGYVAMELVTGTLHGLPGTFVLQHSSTMTRGVPHQSITVVPDSGGGQLAGIAGSMTITVVDGKHSYEFEHWTMDAPNA